MPLQTYKIFALGDSALTIDFGNVIEESLNRKVLAIAAQLKRSSITAVKDVVPAYSSVTVHYDPVTLLKKQPRKSAFAVMKEQLEALLSQATEGFNPVGRHLNIPVCYSKKYALDVSEIALRAKLSVEEVINIHTSKKYRVYMVGFLPGFAYMGEVDDRIAVPRRPNPRIQIEEGYVGIAGKQTGIYPLTSPGGWQIIGKTPVRLFDKSKEEPVLFSAGDEVEFFSITEDEFENY